MVKLTIMNIDGYHYQLKDNKGNVYEVNIDFYGLDRDLHVADEMNMKDSLIETIKTGNISFEAYQKNEKDDNKEAMIIHFQDGVKRAFVKVIE